MKYRKKPIAIEARQFTAEDKDAVYAWMDCRREPSRDASGNPVIVIQTLEGELRASLGDWIIKGVAGEFYPVRADIFAATYEPVEDDHA